MVFPSSHNDLEPISCLRWKKADFVAESSGRSPLLFLWPRSYITAMYFQVPIFLFKMIRMSSKFTAIAFRRINGWSEMPRSSWRSESVNNLQVLFFSQKALFSSSNVIPVLGVSFFSPRLLCPETICGAPCKSWWLWLYSVQCTSEKMWRQLAFIPEIHGHWTLPGPRLGMSQLFRCRDAETQTVSSFRAG